MSKTILVTGGCGFIGSAIVRQLIDESPHRVVNVDCLTYASSPEAVATAAASDRYVFERLDIADAAGVKRIFDTYRPDGVLHLAAESHVDRSIDGPAPFVTTNIVGTYNLLEGARAFLADGAADRGSFRFVHVSTDEVFGELGASGRFSEESPYNPSSPYAASKASADHLVRAWQRTFGVPVIVTNCSNNYGPWQYPEKLIPVAILSALRGGPIPVYGDGSNVRDWLHVEDHARALRVVMESGVPGETYNIGAASEKTNLEVVRTICDMLNQSVGTSSVADHRELIQFVADRPGHDRRYAIDAAKIQRDLAWHPAIPFDSGLSATVGWYLENLAWCERRLGGDLPTTRRGVTA